MFASTLRHSTTNLLNHPSYFTYPGKVLICAIRFFENFYFSFHSCVTTAAVFQSERRREENEKETKGGGEERAGVKGERERENFLGPLSRGSHSLSLSLSLCTLALALVYTKSAPLSFPLLFVAVVPHLSVFPHSHRMNCLSVFVAS